MFRGNTGLIISDQCQFVGLRFISVKVVFFPFETKECAWEIKLLCYVRNNGLLELSVNLLLWQK